MSFKDTLNLPKTDFPIRPSAKVDDPALLERWEKEQLYEKAFKLHEGEEKYVLHDGPPYANGNIHLGHAYNKILKDIITKSRRMMGMHVPVTPGWDCHGLPIELRVVRESGVDMSPYEIKKACRTYAQGWIDIQREEFKKLGVVMDWDHPYITMDPAYEAQIVRAFGKFVEGGYIERKNKTVAWCASCKTTLASAEIEYHNRKDPSIYVEFPLQKETVTKLFPQVGDQSVSLLVWTTTPWTLPLNRGVMLKPDHAYELIEVGGRYVIVGSRVAESVAKLVHAEKHVIASFPSELLQEVRVQHPFIENFTVPIIFDESVGIDEGTASVHTAPGCGPIDYEIGVKNKLEIFSPLTPDGKYAAGIQPVELEGMAITDGQIWVIKKLAELNRMFFKGSITHSYPHCWRCRNGLMYRATPQWFISLDKHDLKDRALNAVEEDIEFIPERSRNFLRATVEHRWEWCVSRQRVWGVPIPALLCRSCDRSYTTPAFVEKVAGHVAREGIEYWDRVSVEEISAGITCSCGASDFVKEHDILDVWFDSGVSHFAVLFGNKNLAYPADLYLEGVDQYRGWYQSSLLTSLVVEKKSCMKAIMSHGFTVDAKGQKMSKSLGNVVAPQELIDKIGTDGLRLWVASIGHDSDAVVSDVLIQNVSEVYRKIRNTSRFLLQNLYDFDIERDGIAVKDLLPIDRYALMTAQKFEQSVIQAYKEYNVTVVFHALADYCASELSSFYLDIIKDRLYVEKADGLKRRSAQTVIYYILDMLTRLMAPILSFTSELIADHYQSRERNSIHLQQFARLDQCVVYDAECIELWQFMKEVRSAVLKAIELLRAQALIKHSLEAHVHLYIDVDAYKQHVLSLLLQEPLLKEFFIVSQVTVHLQQDNLGATALAGVYVSVLPAEGEKCQRCWNFDTKTIEGLCSRCRALVAQ